MAEPVTHAGSLADAFTHVAFKRLKAVEADATRSNQHEFNASPALREMFGRDQPQRLATDFVWMPDDGAYLSLPGELTWYDARARHPRRSEYRLYYRDNPVSALASEGDLLVIARRPDGRVLLLLAPGESIAATRIAWLFGMEVSPGASFAALGSHTANSPALPGEFIGGLAGEHDDWEAEDGMTASAGDEKVRAGTAVSQNRVARITHDDRPSWGDAPAQGPAMEATVEGLLRPRS